MKLFGTDGLRGNAGEFPLDPSSVRRVGREVGASLSDRRTVVLGGDTRESTPALIEELAEGLVSARAEVACAGVIPTPGIAELVLALNAGAGISVSASHNPYQDNGIKIFGADGKKWPDEREEAVERVLLAERGRGGQVRDRGDGSGGPKPDGSLAGIYLARLREHVPADLAGLSVLVDTGNGAAHRLAPEALRAAGAVVHAVFDRPDGRNINADCGALHPGGMAAATRSSGASLGVALDGDADRSIFADENGRILDGDDVLWIVAREWKRTGRLTPGGVVGTVMSNFGLEAALEREGVPFRRAAVGDRNVARLMEETGACVGGETSGHVLLPFSPAGDGIQTTLLLASIVASSRAPLSRLATLEKTPQVLRNVRVARRVPYEEVPSIAAALARARASVDGRGRIFLRYSGTELLLRILVEGPEEKEVVSVADELESAVRAGLAE
jgi:phosphoglucosamine mutase